MTGPRDVAFIGVGRMATPMVWRFIERGWRTHLFDLAPSATEPFRKQPLATIHHDIDSLARAADTVLLSLPTPAALREVSRQLAVTAHENAVTPNVVTTSTAGPAATVEAAGEFAAAGLPFIDAPVSGGAAGARAGSLTIIVSGNPHAVRSCDPVFEIIGRRVFRVGPRPGQAQVMKVANNVLSLGALAATAEATALTSKAGIPLDVAIDVLNASSGHNSATSTKFPDFVLTRRFDFGFPVEGALKDVSLFTELAEELGIPAPLAQAVVDCWARAADRGFATWDCTHIATMYRELAGLPGIEAQERTERDDRAG